MTEETYSLEEVAAAHLPMHWKNPTRWLVERLNRRELRGVRFGRTWRMRERDVEFMLSRYANDGKVTSQPKPAPGEATCIADGLSQRSRRRIRVAS